MFKKIREKFLLLLASIAGPFFILLLGKTWKLIWAGEEKLAFLRKKNKNVIYAFWHGRMLILSFSHRWQKIHILISQHRDGEYIACTVKNLGFVPVRGSTTRGGTKALFEMAKQGAAGYDIAITPDGPAGPGYQVQRGVLYLASRTGMPIVPITDSAQKSWILKSWDGFIIPKPFTRAVIIVGEPIFVSQDISEAEIEQKKNELEQKLMRITNWADNFFTSGIRVKKKEDVVSTL